MSDGRWYARELKAQDRAKLEELVTGAHRGESIYLRGALERLQAEGASRDPNAAWWWGVFRNGTELEAAMSVENHLGLVYGANEEAMKAFASELFAMQKRLGTFGGGTHRHQLLGESRALAVVWNVMKDLPGRKLVSDRECELLSGAERAAASPSTRIVFERATRADERTVVDYLAENRLEQLQLDPRKVNKDAHTQRCMAAVADGRVWLGKEKDSGRPFFAAELTPLTKDAVLLDQLYVPPHFRSRGKLVGGAFWAAAALSSDKEVFCLAHDKTLIEAAKSAGWKRKSGYRWIITLG